MEIDELLEIYGPYAFEQQDALSEFLGDHQWLVDVPSGTVDFGRGRNYPIQLIGTVSTGADSWLWAWANAGSNIPEPLLSSVNRIRDFGAREGVTAFVEPELALGTVDPHIFGLIASGMTGADGYYLGHHERGAVLFLLQDPSLRALLNPSVLRMNTIFMTFISTWAVPNHQAAFEAYARAKQCQVETSGSHVDCVNADGEKICGDFESGRLVQLSLDLGPNKNG